MRKSKAVLDQATFRRLYDAHVGFVQFVAARVGWQGAKADDVVQETFMRLYLKPPAKLDDQLLRAWLGTTARRVMVDLARKGRRETPDADAGTKEAPALWAQDPEAMEREVEIAAVRELVEEIAQVPGGEVFREFYVDGLKAKEIAAKRGEALSTVTTKLSRLREKFRTEITKRLQEMTGHDHGP